jgi:outer membrane lipoprotein-sorting protein
MRHALAILLLPAFVTPARAQDNEAEKLYRDMEKRIRTAKAFQVAVRIELAPVNKRRGRTTKVSFLITKDNQARLEVDGDFSGGEGKRKIALVSDGKRFKISDSDGAPAFGGGDKSSRPTPKYLHDLYSVTVSRGGLWFSLIMMPYVLPLGQEGSPAPDADGKDLRPDEDKSRMEIWDFQMDADKVGAADAKVIRYKFGEKRGPEREAVKMTLWLDAKTLLPLKSDVVISRENLHITETYTEFTLDPKIDAKAFALTHEVNDAEKLFRAMEEKLKAAKAVQVTFEFTAKTKAKEEKLKGSLV